MTARLTWLVTRWRSSFAAVAWLAVLFCAGCTDPAPGLAILTAEHPLHLEDHLDVATIEGAEVPADLLHVVEWRFDEPQPDWRSLGPIFSEREGAHVEFTEDALRIRLDESNRGPVKRAPYIRADAVHGSVYVDLPDWRRADWEYVLVTARTSEPCRGSAEGCLTFLELQFNRGEREGPSGGRAGVLYRGQRAPVVTDGEAHTYRLGGLDQRTGAWCRPHARNGCAA